MYLVLDTNILHQEGLSSRNMLLLSRLSKSLMVSIFIPEIVKREYLSKKIASAKEDLSLASSKLDSIKKWVGVNNTITNEVRVVERAFKALHQNVEETIINSFDQWVESCHINIVDFEPNNITNVLNDYFSGGGVFRKAKNRDDFPDAMILTTIQDILGEIDTETESMSIIIKDGNFRDYLNTIKGVNTFSNLSELFESPPTKTLIDRLDSESKRIEAIKKILANEDIQNRFHEYLLSDKAYLESTFITDEILSNGQLGYDIWDTYIEGIETDSIENVEFGDVNFTDDNSFFINLSFYGVALLHYTASHLDYIHLSEERKRTIIYEGMDGDAICNLTEKLRFKISGQIEIFLFDTMSPEEFKVHTQYIKTDDSELAIIVSLKSAQIAQLD